ncbi:hypothetical protein B0H17DRAFT_1142668 [Mycena rosella]|uniref:Uncharacterized protein n=1 Tax=Mycena rosella TaxID=1033263 RepID=A0AAD7CWY8_MYCRO|nr:hypothetical protein B0H17DRAFT_1142668 [Mycena rosella]
MNSRCEKLGSNVGPQSKLNQSSNNVLFPSIASAAPFLQELSLENRKSLSKGTVNVHKLCILNAELILSKKKKPLGKRCLTAPCVGSGSGNPGFDPGSVAAARLNSASRFQAVGEWSLEVKTEILQKEDLLMVSLNDEILRSTSKVEPTNQTARERLAEFSRAAATLDHPGSKLIKPGVPHCSTLAILQSLANAQTLPRRNLQPASLSTSRAKSRNSWDRRAEAISWPPAPMARDVRIVDFRVQYDSTEANEGLKINMERRLTKANSSSLLAMHSPGSVYYYLSAGDRGGGPGHRPHSEKMEHTASLSGPRPDPRQRLEISPGDAHSLSYLKWNTTSTGGTVPAARHSSRKRLKKRGDFPDLSENLVQCLWGQSAVPVDSAASTNLAQCRIESCETKWV